MPRGHYWSFIQNDESYWFHSKATSLPTMSLPIGRYLLIKRRIWLNVMFTVKGEDLDSKHKKLLWQRISLTSAIDSCGFPCRRVTSNRSKSNHRSPRGSLIVQTSKHDVKAFDGLNLFRHHSCQPKLTQSDNYTLTQGHCICSTLSVPRHGMMHNSTSNATWANLSWTCFHHKGSQGFVSWQQASGNCRTNLHDNIWNIKQCSKVYSSFPIESCTTWSLKSFEHLWFCPSAPFCVCVCVCYAVIGQVRIWWSKMDFNPHNKIISTTGMIPVFN